MATDDLEASMHAVSRMRWRFAFLLTALMLFLYFGFILLVAFSMRSARPLCEH